MTQAGLVRCILLGAGLLVSACSKDPSASSDPVAASVRIVAPPNRIRFVDSVQLNAEALDAAGRVLSTPVTWSSNAATKVSVSPSGRIVGEATGKAWITVRAGSLTDSAEVSVAPHYVQIAAGHQFACALTDTGVAYCWGRSGALGISADSSSAAPVAVDTDTPFASIFASRAYACALTFTGEPYCWGHVAEAGITYRTPRAVQSTKRFRRLGAGLFAIHGVTTDSAHYWWGFVFNLNRPQPVLFDATRRYVDATFNEVHGCVVSVTNSAYCWGYNGIGQFGNGSYESDYVSLVPAFTGFSVLRIVAGNQHTCALMIDASAYCSGQGDQFGTLGDGSSTSFTNQPRRVAISEPIRAIAAGNKGMCAVTVAGASWCWGSFIRVASTPWLVSSQPAFVDVSVGDGSAYGLTSRGTIFGWGRNASGELGDGTRTSTDAPVRVIDPP